MDCLFKVWIILAFCVETGFCSHHLLIFKSICIAEPYDEACSVAISSFIYNTVCCTVFFCFVMLPFCKTSRHLFLHAPSPPSVSHLSTMKGWVMCSTVLQHTGSLIPEVNVFRIPLWQMEWQRWGWPFCYLFLDMGKLIYCDHVGQGIWAVLVCSYCMTFWVFPQMVKVVDQGNLFGNVTLLTAFMSMVFYICSFSEVEQVELDCLLGMILCLLVIR